MRLHFQQELENDFKFRAEGDFELLSLTLGGDVGNERAAGDNEGQVPITHTNRLSHQTDGDGDGPTTTAAEQINDKVSSLPDLLPLL